MTDEYEVKEGHRAGHLSSGLPGSVSMPVGPSGLTSAHLLLQEAEHVRVLESQVRVKAIRLISLISLISLIWSSRARWAHGSAAHSRAPCPVALGLV